MAADTEAKAREWAARATVGELTEILYPQEG
jgi:hypothetical protein